MSLTALLGIARSALSARQAQLSTTGHNIANADTPGYTRQRVRLGPSVPLRIPTGQLGTGVDVLGVERVRNRHLDNTFRAEAAQLGDASTLSEGLGQIESVLGEPGDTGLAASLDAFWSSWGDLANNPGGAAERSMVRQRTRELITGIRGIATRIDTARADLLAQLRQDVGTVNSITARIATLNTAIGTAQGAGASAPDLADERDRLIDELSTIAPVRVLERSDGTVGVLLGDALVVDAALARDLAVGLAPGGDIAIVEPGSGLAINMPGGRVRATLELINARLPELTSQLDDLAGALVTQVNAQHATGITPGGLTGTDFFSAAGTTAATLALTPAIDASADAIAAGTSGAPGDGSLALAITGLRSAGLPELGGNTAGAYYADVVAKLGARAADAGRRTTAQDTLLAEIESQRNSVHGVSVDEELANLLSYQQAYVAATRIVTAADQMMQELLRMV